VTFAVITTVAAGVGTMVVSTAVGGIVASAVGTSVATAAVGTAVGVTVFAGWVQPLAATSRITRIHNPKNFFIFNSLILPYN
jgi:hypothetical protein